MRAAALLSIHVQQLMVGSFALPLGTCPLRWLVFEGAGLGPGAVARSEASHTEIGESHYLPLSSTGIWRNSGQSTSE